MVTKFQQETLKSRFAQAKVLVVGDVMLDRYWFGDVSRISPEAPVPVAKIARIDQRAGVGRIDDARRRCFLSDARQANCDYCQIARCCP